jgi:threonine dehydrogenase-like Zn-dependent dehydrogenase
VSIDPNVLCGYCGYCKSGIGHYCENMKGIGTTVNGGFAQYWAVPFRALYPLGKDVSFAEGAMAEPLSCCLHGIDMCDIQVGNAVVIIGGGMIGLLMLQLAKLSGAAVTALIEPVAAKRAQAGALGANVCIDPFTEDVPHVLKEAGITRVNTVIECVGKSSTIKQAIELAGNKSTVMMFGLTKPEETVEILPYNIFAKEITLRASYINPYTLSRAMALINNKTIDVHSMVAQIIPLEQLAAALSDGELRAQGKIIVDPWIS